MKINSNVFSSIAVVMIVGLLSPGWVYAEANNSEPTSSQGKGIGAGNFCAKVGNIKIDQDIADQISRLQKDYQTRTAEISQGRSNRDTEKGKNRSSYGVNLEQHYDKLRAKATTEVQKAAVEKFIAAVTAANKVRQAAVDAAVKAFQEAVDKPTLARRTALIPVLNTYYTAVKAAITKAKAACAAAGDSTTVRNTFVAELKAARAKMQTEKQALDKLETTVKDLSTAKKAALTKAQNDFKAAVEAAKAELKLVMS